MFDGWREVPGFDGSSIEGWMVTAVNFCVEALPICGLLNRTRRCLKSQLDSECREFLPQRISAFDTL